MMRGNVLFLLCCGEDRIVLFISDLSILLMFYNWWIIKKWAMMQRKNFHSSAVRYGTIRQIVYLIYNNSFWKSSHSMKPWKDEHFVRYENISNLLAVCIAWQMGQVELWSQLDPQSWYVVILIKIITMIIMSAMASQIISITIVFTIVYSGTDQRNNKAPRHWPCEGNSLVTDEFPVQMAYNAENISI